mmetsp:Transcript_12387/g.20138  ORF Transcript_12387/g.20138 Transcript_12387/m.20138 type:complete len:755 (-) Transcript_12387:307-2571(-)
MAKLTPSGGRQILRLKIGDAPKNPFVGQDFTINIHLVDDAGKLKCGDEIPIIMNLCFEEKPLRPCPPELLSIRNADDPTQDPKDFTISKSGSIRLTVRINELSMRYENKKLVLRASTENINGLYVQSAISLPMLCVKYRLVIENNTLPDVWFKDEGGRDKCIELNISLQDHNHDTIVERKVPLKVMLLYADGNPVLKQEILKISPDSKLHLDERGRASLRLRIDDVSKNHQKQCFLIQIAPDTNSHPLNNDISPDECTPLEVRSKRNKGKRPREDDAPPVPPAPRASGNGAAQKIAIVNSGTAKATPSTGIAAKAKSSGPSVSFAPPSSDAQTVSRTVIEKTALENKRLNDLMTNFNKEDKPRDAPSREQVGKTIQGLVEWSQSMMDALASLQWQYIGNEKLPNGAVQPLYEMRNPNNTITELFNAYQDFAVPSLTLLYHDHHSNGGSGGVSDEDGGNIKQEASSSSSSVVPGYIPLPKSSTGLQSFSGMPLNSPLNVNFPSPATSKNGPFSNISNIGKNFSTDSGFSTASAVTLGLPMAALPTSSNGNSLQSSLGNPARFMQSNIARFSSTSSSVSNPSGAPTTMPEFGRDSSNLFAGGIPGFSNTSTAEFFQDLDFDAGNSIVGKGGNQNYENIFYLLGKRFFSKLVTEPLECPAYDMNRKLIGFVTSKSDQNVNNQLEATSTSFLSISEYPANLLSEDEIAEANKIGTDLIDANVNSVFLRSYYVDEAQFIDAAMIHLIENAEDINLSVQK